MMYVQKLISFYTCGCTLIGIVLSHSIKNSVLQSTNEMIKRQSLKCNTDCPFGFVADVEGDLTCRCLDPCSNIMCIASECVAKMPPHCDWDTCKPETRCEVKPELTKIRKHDMIAPNEGKFQPSFFQDDPDKWWGNGNDVCSQPLPVAAVTCKDKRKRWFYHPTTGQCEPFRGCVTSGNNFSRKRHCKSRCRRNIIRPEVLRSICRTISYACGRNQVNQSVKRRRNCGFIMTLRVNVKSTLGVRVTGTVLREKFSVKPRVKTRWRCLEYKNNRVHQRLVQDGATSGKMADTCIPLLYL